jgi:putative DNA primase/helicase
VASSQTAKAGQSIRILNIPLFGEYGAFNDLHDKKGGRALADHLLTASSKYYGVAGIEYLTKLVAEIRDLGAQFDDAKKKLIGDEKLSPQEARGAKRFALAALAGKMATHYGVTGWETLDASYGVKECFVPSVCSQPCFISAAIVRFKPLAFVASSIPASLNR